MLPFYLSTVGVHCIIVVSKVTKGQCNTLWFVFADYNNGDQQFYLTYLMYSVTLSYYLDIRSTLQNPTSHLVIHTVKYQISVSVMVFNK